MDIYTASIPGCPWLGSKTIRHLLSVFKTGEKIWNATSEELYEKGKLTSKQLNSFLKYRKEADLEKIYKLMQNFNIKYCTLNDEVYPKLLANTINPPPVLYYRGELPVTDRIISIVGIRKATVYGIKTAKEIAKELSERNIVIVSGGARGIDSAAHKGALEGKSATVTVAACGLDKTYPAENRNLFEKIIAHGGCIISEYAPGTPPLGRQFPARNRIIAGMTRGVIVIEAAEKSGSLITADFALEEGRDIFAVPGNIWAESSKGTNKLLKIGAFCCTSYEDILSEYGWENKKEIKCKKDKTFNKQLTLEEEVLYRFCSESVEITEDELLIKTGMSLKTLKSLLLQLQLKGVVIQTPSGGFIISG